MARMIKMMLLCFGLGVFFTACQRNATVEQQITFKGYVSKAHIDTGTGLIVYDGPCVGADVMCTTYGGSTKTDASGNYVLSVTTIRKFSAENADEYKICATGNGGNDETVTVYGKPGDTITVRAIALYKHTEEK